MDERGLGKRLQSARLTAGLTQQQLCHKADLSFSTLTKIERGAIKAPSIFTVQAIAAALGVSLDDLVGRSPNALGRTKGGAKFVYFDVNGCLIYFWQHAFDKLSLATGIDIEIIESTFWRYNDEVCRGEMSVEQFNAILAKQVGLKELSWQDYYLDSVEPITDMQELLVWASEHYKVGLLTNTMPGLIESMRRSRQLPTIHYSAIVDSSVVGAIKPEKKIYEIAEEKAGCSPEEILLIDDNNANLAAANRLGWHVLWFDDSRLGESLARVKKALEPEALSD